MRSSISSVKLKSKLTQRGKYCYEVVDVDHPDLLCHILPTADHWLLITTLSESPDSGSGSEAGSGRQAVKETPVWEPSRCWRATPANYSSIY